MCVQFSFCCMHVYFLVHMYSFVCGHNFDLCVYWDLHLTGTSLSLSVQTRSNEINVKKHVYAHVISMLCCVHVKT